LKVHDDQPDWALRLLNNALDIARLVDRSCLFSILKQSMPLFAEIYDGESLWEMYEYMLEVDDWWHT
jgi:hypothetical protein